MNFCCGSPRVRFVTAALANQCGWQTNVLARQKVTARQGCWEEAPAGMGAGGNWPGGPGERERGKQPCEHSTYLTAKTTLCIVVTY